jgi:protoporphyrinogen oxidase
MDRRTFIRLSALSLLPAYACREQGKPVAKYDIHLHSDQATGHLVFESLKYPIAQTIKKDVLIVGAGVAGLASACQLPDHNLVVCELSDRLGGSAASQEYGGEVFCQGAHYDLTYPPYFGDETLGFLASLGIIQQDPLTRKWLFSDRQYIIDPDRESQCLAHGRFREDVLPDDGSKERFADLMRKYTGKLLLPSRLIPEQYHSLNQRPFIEFIKEHLDISPAFARGIDYQMLDDFSGTSKEVSALAGICYYANRPYWDEDNETFSPPEGNFYFVRKLAERAGQERILLNHLVRRINLTGAGFEVEVVDILAKTVKLFQVKQVVYAGQKHALKHVLPGHYPLFTANQYIPWVVVNFVLQPSDLAPGFWQNEIISTETSFLGFIDSDAQHTNGKKRVLTAYYCFPNWFRTKLDGFRPEALVEQTAAQIAGYFGLDEEDIRLVTEKVFVNVMGHAMALPKPGHLLHDRNLERPLPGLVYAGVDNGRLPLFFEAVDSGLTATAFLLNGRNGQ